MTDRTQPEAGSTHIIRFALELGLLWIDGSGRDKVREALDALDALEAKLASIGAGGVQALSAAPAGWKLVPEDATEEMVRATDKVNFANADTDGTMHNVWNVMLAASPTPPAEQQAAPKAAPVLPEGWTACTIEFGNDGPEEVAYGPQRMMTRLAKWLGKYFARVIADAAPKAAPVVWLSSEQLRGVTALHGQYLPFRCQPEGRFDTPVYLVEAAPKAAPGEQNAVSAEWLEQAYREGWAACRDAETIGEEAEDWAFGNSTANSRMIDAQQAAPQQEAQEPFGYAWRESPFGWGFCSKQAYEQAAARGEEVAKLYTAPQPAPAPLSERTDAEIVAQTVELTKYLMSWKWGLEPECDASRIWESKNTKAQVCWNAACHIQDLLTQTDVWNAVTEVDGATLAAQGGK